MSPDVVVIGAQKSGTSTFYRNLVNCAVLNFTRQKEANILISLEDNAAIQQAYDDAFVVAHSPRIDVSPKYSQVHLYPGVAKKLFSINPAAKIVFLVRDPIDRIKSQLGHNLLRDRINKSLEHEVLSNSDYVLTSSYFYQIKDYLDFFPLEQIMVYPFEKMVSDTVSFQLAFFEFAGVSSNPIQFKPYNVTSNRYIIKHYDFIHRVIHNSYLLKCYHLFWWMVSLRPKKVFLPDHLQKKLCEQLRDDIDLFIAKFDIDRHWWKSYEHIKNMK